MMLAKFRKREKEYQIIGIHYNHKEIVKLIVLLGLLKNWLEGKDLTVKWAQILKQRKDKLCDSFGIYWDIQWCRGPNHSTKASRI